MKAIRKIAITVSLLLIVVLLTSCSNEYYISFDGYYVSDISLSGIKFSEVHADSSSAYFLSRDGVLYCTGADVDAGAYVVLQDPQKAIVAENVKSFGEMSYGGYYIDFNNDLYIWHRNELPLYEYNTKRKHKKVLEGVTYAIVGTDIALYIDENSDLYLIGSYGDESYSINEPKLLANDVVCADISGADYSIIWVKSDGDIGTYGEIDSDMVATLNSQFADSGITDIFPMKNYVAVLSNNELWFYGDYQKLITGEESGVIELTKLADGIESISCSPRLVAALDFDGNAYLWGRCLSNDLYNTHEVQYEYYEKVCWAKDAVNVYVSGSVYCYIHENGSSNIYYDSKWFNVYGNSTDNECVGINRDPCTWIE